MDARAQLIKAERRLGKLAGRTNKRSALLKGLKEGQSKLSRALAASDLVGAP